jgi:hypothetical protein
MSITGEQHEGFASVLSIALDVFIFSAWFSCSAPRSSYNASRLG